MYTHTHTQKSIKTTFRLDLAETIWFDNQMQWDRNESILISHLECQ